MKKMTFAIITALILLSVLFAACNGADSGKVSDTHRNDPVLTELEDMVTEAATDIRDMMTDAFDDGMTNVAE